MRICLTGLPALLLLATLSPGRAQTIPTRVGNPTGAPDAIDYSPSGVHRPETQRITDSLVVAGRRAAAKAGDADSAKLDSRKKQAVWQKTLQLVPETTRAEAMRAVLIDSALVTHGKTIGGADATESSLRPWTRRRITREARRQVTNQYWASQRDTENERAAALVRAVDSITHVKRGALRAKRPAPTPEDYGKKLFGIEQKRDDSLRKRQTYLDLAQFYEYRRINRNHVRLIPVNHRYHAQLYFESNSSERSNELLAKAQTVINPNTGKLSIYNELYGDYVGWTRWSFGTTLVGSNQGEATTPAAQQQEAAVQRFVGGGGNGLLTVAFPFFSVRSHDDIFVLKMTVQGRAATDLPQNNSTTNDFAYHSNLGLDLFTYYTGLTRTITPFGYVRYGESWGNGAFYDNLGRADRGSLGVFQITAGIDVNEVLQLAGTYYSGSSFIRDTFPFSLSLSLQPRLASQRAKPE